MSARLARSVFSSATRRAQASASSSARTVSRRAMSTTSHGSAVSSDTPWIIGSAVFFGPLLLYLLSPSAKKQSHPVHNDKRDFPTLGHGHGHEHAPAKAVEPMLMKDDEGSVADVGASSAVAEASDIPKDSQSAEEHDQLVAAASEGAEASEAKVPISETRLATEGTKPSVEKPPVPEVNSDSESAKGKKIGTFQEEGESGPTDLSVAQEASQKGVAPKQAAEAHN
ncbi:hypothetical protein M413DRAFT_443837 [Hebeloma cylindrosporum]|uniref:Uncharacterized protein n=1 Tax=Hebeloma cylindrosporum TaxID=76867 RepID=A0A0C3CHB8_HEBCY|nr:hypothetical protein M413DRAFT_443837 [Hebeloma cylindrosporum h7]